MHMHNHISMHPPGHCVTVLYYLAIPASFYVIRKQILSVNTGSSRPLSVSSHYEAYSFFLLLSLLLSFNAPVSYDFNSFCFLGRKWDEGEDYNGHIPRATTHPNQC